MAGDSPRVPGRLSRPASLDVIVVDSNRGTSASHAASASWIRCAFQTQTPTPTLVVAKPVPAKLPELIATIDDDRVERWELEGAITGIEARAGAPIPADKRDEIVRGLVDQLVAYHILVREAHD